MMEAMFNAPSDEKKNEIYISLEYAQNQLKLNNLGRLKVA
jgi:hypothetical protein